MVWHMALVLSILEDEKRTSAHPACSRGVRSTSETIVRPGAMGGGSTPCPGGRCSGSALAVREAVQRDGACGA